MYGRTTKAFLGENLRRADRLIVVGQQVLRVAHDLDLDEVAAAECLGEVRNAHGFLCRAGAGGIGQQGDILRHVVEDVLLLLRVCAAHGHRDELCLGIAHGRIDEIERVLARAQDEARVERVTAEREAVCCHSLFNGFC